MMITKIISKKDQKMDKKEIFDKLTALNPNDPYRKKKAAGSLGGSKTHGYLADDGNDYRCTRDAK